MTLRCARCGGRVFREQDELLCLNCGLRLTLPDPRLLLDLVRQRLALRALMARLEAV